MWKIERCVKTRAVQGRVQDADIKSVLLRGETCFDLAALIHSGGKKRDYALTVQ